MYTISDSHVQIYYNYLKGYGTYSDKFLATTTHQNHIPPWHIRLHLTPTIPHTCIIMFDHISNLVCY